MDKKLIIGTILVILIILGGGTWLVSKQDERLKIPLKGQEIAVESRNHVPDGTEIQYNSNPPAAGSHYATTAHSGIYETPPPDGNLVHSLEHGAVILWYKTGLPPDDIEKLKKVYYEASGGKKIMTPRESLDVPVAISSWGRVLKLQTIEEKQIKDFFETNHDRAPEQAPI